MKTRVLIMLILLFSFVLHGQDTTGDQPEPQPDTVNEEVVEETRTETTNNKKNGWDYYISGQYYESIKALKEEMNAYPDRINIYIILGWDYKALKDFRSMEKISSEGLEISPGDLRLIKNMAEALYFQKKYVQSADFFESYLKYRNIWNDAYLSTAYLYLGISYYHMQHYNKADIALATSNHYAPNNVWTLLYMGKTKEGLQKNEEALTLFKRVTQLAPANQEGQDALKRLEETLNSGT